MADFDQEGPFEERTYDPTCPYVISTADYGHGCFHICGASVRPGDNDCDSSRHKGNELLRIAPCPYFVEEQKIDSEESELEGSVT